MRVRHKQPTLVSMWMLDVFCCALGCVTLLFLLNSRMASDEAEANKTALIDLRTTERVLAATVTERDQLRLRLNSEEAGRVKLSAALTEAEGLRLKLSDEATALAKQLATTTSERDDLAKKLALSQKEAKDAKALADATQLALNAAEAKVTADAKELAAVRATATDADDVLRKKQKEADALAKKLLEMNASADDLARLLRKRDDEKVVLTKQAADLKKQLDDLDARTAGTRKEYDAAAAQIKDLTKKVSEANVTIVDLQGDKAKLADKFDKLQKETDARFAGIVTAGKRVVFLVDISGSMAKRDSETADPTKWPIVVETVSKVMRSVVGLEKYQVVIFSSSAKWLFGTGDWRDYEGEKSIDDVKKALTAVKPHEDTNLHAGLEKAFALRESGLDVIYLFSDGLPTSGPGLTLAEQTRRPPLSELELGEKLGKHIRKNLADTWNRSLAGKPRVKIHAVGFFFESPDVGAFLWALARENDGSFVGMSRP
ncbi:VWA domain-containing protein [Gemmata sp.]|uniref:vWA domain-containing protein n=1 Tax=Gemmata sp. TaxID=1914242 RepID=UPI003F70F7D6